MAEAGVKLIGVPQALRTLESLGRRIEKKVLVKAVRAAGKVYLDEARRQAPQGNKLLKRSLINKLKRYPNYLLAIVGQQKRKTFTSAKIRRRGGISGRGIAVPIHLVEGDTKAHRIRPKTARWLAFDSGGQLVFARAVRHPGTRGQHFVRKAARRAQADSTREFADKLARETLAEANKAS